MTDEHATQRSAETADTPLADQVVVVVGGTKGIGAAIAVDAAAAGAGVVVAGRNAEKGASVVERITAAGGRGHSVACDVTVEGDCERLAEFVADHAGRLDTVFANQGVAPGPRPLIDWDEAAIRSCVEVNLLGCLRLARATHSLLAADGGGRFVVTGSASGHENVPGLGMYGTSKAAVSHLVRQLAAEWRRDRIAVNEMIPGPVRTEMTGYDAQGESARADNPFEAFAERVGEWLKDPEDVAPLARFLATLPANGPTGQVFSLNGRV